MNATSHLWPSIAAGTTWWPDASRDLHRGDDGLRSSAAVGLQKRCSTPRSARRADRFAHPVEATRGSAVAARCAPARVHVAAGRRGRTRRASCPAVRAVSTASAVGALTATSDAEPGRPRLLHHLEARPPADEQPHPCAGSRPSSSSRPTTLSTALWRPTSSRTISGPPRRRRMPPRRAPRRSTSNRPCPPQHSVGHASEDVNGIAASDRRGVARAVA